MGLEEALLPAAEGVLERVRQHLRGDEADAHRRLHRHGEGVDVDVDPHAAAAVEMGDRVGDAAEIGAERHRVAVLALAVGELVVEELEAFDPAGERLEMLGRLEVPRLQADHRDDHREVVLDPVLDLAERDVGVGRRPPRAVRPSTFWTPRKYWSLPAPSKSGAIISRFQNGVPFAR
jgi:hypothetical protein